ncbi:ankyrin repeat domain-containing protein [Wolbachia endosymbiont of Tettigetta isshikii]|uniref:ankyrin repeat domain-containing protein n=1 Tax=Wolbachia endosymbiont of Tettigetta isshikii TaxID=3239093 RepID=UPI00397F8A22
MIPETRKEAFEVLGLSGNASGREIKKVYHKLIKQWHPNKWVDKSKEEQKIATKKSQKITVAYEILTGKIKDESTRQQPNDDWYKKPRGSYFSKEEKDLFDALSRQDLTKTKALLKQVQNINAQTKLHNIMTGESILHYIVKNSCNNPKSGWRELLQEVLSKYSANNSTPVIDVNIMSKLHGTPLHVACELGNLDVVNVLLEHGADPNVYGFVYKSLHYALKEDKIDVAEALLEHGAKAGELNPLTIIKYSKNAVEVLLPHLSDKTKGLMLYHIIKDSVETDHDIEIVELLLLDACVDLDYYIRCAEEQGESKPTRLFNEHKENAINNDSHSSGGRWIIIVPTLLFGAIGAKLAAMGIIPEIAAIWVIATSVLSGIAGAVIGDVAGYLVDVAISQCCGNQQCAA